MFTVLSIQNRPVALLLENLEIAYYTGHTVHSTKQLLMFYKTEIEDNYLYPLLF